MKSINIYFIAILTTTTLVSCEKDGDQKGCTDPISINYDPSALVDDGTCEYNQTVQSIWTNGIRGGWNGDLQQGAFRFEVCGGVHSELEEIVDSTEVRKTLYLGTGGGNSHLSYFSLINEQNARDFNDGSLRMDVRVSDTDDGAPEFINLFISGKIHENDDCLPYRRSEYVQISTHSFNDSLFTTVNVPIRDFSQIMMARVEVTCGISFQGERSTGVEIDNIRWEANILD
jgi:hypothetical protein